MKKTNKVFLISSFLLLFIDQFIKQIMYLNRYSINVINNFFNITYVENKGAAFGILANKQILLAIIGIIFIMFFIKYIFSLEKLNNYMLIYSIFLTSGVIGNLIDRILRGYVIDYLDFNILGYDFPVFNLADILIVLGMILIVFEYVIRGNNHDM